MFASSLAIYLFFGLWSAAAVGPGADEPHYLVITQSLLRDHDLAIENNHARGDYREYFGGELRPDFLRRGLNEVIYSIHAPGLPALLVPAYAVAGYRGAVVMLCLFGALAALAIYDLAALLAGPGTAWLAWAATCLTVPFVPHSWLIFPEMPGALLVAWAALWLYAPLPARARTWIWRGAALAMLPWLHTKFVILLAAMAAALAAPAVADAAGRGGAGDAGHRVGGAVDRLVLSALRRLRSADSVRRFSEAVRARGEHPARRARAAVRSEVRPAGVRADLSARRSPAHGCMLRQSGAGGCSRSR